MHWYLNVLKNYARFRGSAQRKEFWYFTLFQILIFFIISFLERLFAVANPEVYMGWFSAIYLLLTFLPALAVTARRLHDINCSAWWLLLHLIPFVGTVILLILAALKSQTGSNKYR
ncbi:DUF805 domain-containing protein [Xenorhabdus nematophila]|uniref:Membrane protein n=1 Tax=Xenorhabdus nematophila (strain ATCC 19061 / DSM 3370 / CCUG 14189 / LMG 1036 / NCIMB 9965 / AN6) TaxID=406817 RepID=D3VFL8_XENNA|nr:DUF805 domain-containing protein [Xenorhabdus nematophila]CEE89924.1 putative membrane protein [Xenorhabdus nematophila str. Anatoliense]CEF29290.1 putative membrane protein [Xenorhabdus nematophila str. Websteri]AYA40210.1 DUF805 domain-containing protein [Xenorhabdus nematophila]KHD27817.1 membrane protein [Xenorhabdus nematophila]MBA0018880.1 DUF805 domain-containing protein [Xenorhabdus nematophila]